jgi:hypothetical protein
MIPIQKDIVQKDIVQNDLAPLQTDLPRDSAAK